MDIWAEPINFLVFIEYVIGHSGRVQYKEEVIVMSMDQKGLVPNRILCGNFAAFRAAETNMGVRVTTTTSKLVTHGRRTPKIYYYVGRNIRRQRTRESS